MNSNNIKGSCNYTQPYDMQKSIAYHKSVKEKIRKMNRAQTQFSPRVT